MNEAISERWKDLIDHYLDGTLDETELAELEAAMLYSADARQYFALYGQMNTDIHLHARARLAQERALQRVAGLGRAPQETKPPLRFPPATQVLAAASILVAAVAFAWLLIPRSNASPVAWLINAQNCKWSESEPPKNMLAKTSLGIDQGLAEIRFDCGARVVLEGPARLELLSGKSARLHHGKLTARVPPSGSGFEILSPQGKVIDLGTEFGMSVSAQGATEVYVFEGKVEALPAAKGAAPVSLTEKQSAQMAGGRVVVKEAEPATFVREIVPAPVLQPRKLTLAFNRNDLGGILDRGGLGTGLTDRLPGTGYALKARDSNLLVNLDKQQLELLTTDSDLNTQYKLFRGEYLGVRLSRFGFTGGEDFEVRTKIIDIPALEFVGQFGLYAGTRSDKSIRGGLLSQKRNEDAQYTQFLVNNCVRREGESGTDFNIGKVGLLATGVDLQLTLKRFAGKYSLSVDNLTDGTSSTLTIPHPEFLDGEKDLHVGLFGANTQSIVRRTLIFTEFEVTVWTSEPEGQ